MPRISYQTHRRVPYGCSIYITTRCNHACRHCYLNCSPNSGEDMSDDIFHEIVDRCARYGLLKNVTLVGGEPFINIEKLFERIRMLINGHGVLELFIPTNGRWVLSDNYLAYAAELEEYGQWIPYELRVAFSYNQWNIEQLGEHAQTVTDRWSELEELYPSVFRHRELIPENMSNLGRAKKFGIAQPGAGVGAHCSFDDWIDPHKNLGFYSDYLSFWPDGSCRACYAGGPVLGNYEDDYKSLLDKREQFLFFIREQLTSNMYESLPAESCEVCETIYQDWIKQVEQ